MEKVIADTKQNQWLYKIAMAIQNFGGVNQITNLDQNNPIILRSLESGVYVLHGFFKPCEPVSQVVMAQAPLYASIVKTETKSYVQLFYAVNNAIQYFEITDTNYICTSDTGWKDVTLTSDFKSYNTTSNPQYRKINGVVYLRGVLSPSKELTSSSVGITMFTLPVGYRPTKSLMKLCQGSGKNTWLMTVDPDGRVTLARYGITANTTLGTGTWLPFEISFPI